MICANLPKHTRGCVCFSAVLFNSTKFPLKDYIPPNNSCQSTDTDMAGGWQDYSVIFFPRRTPASFNAESPHGPGCGECQGVQDPSLVTSTAFRREIRYVCIFMYTASQMLVGAVAMTIHLLKSKTGFIISLWHSIDFSHYNGEGPGLRSQKR